MRKNVTPGETPAEITVSMIDQDLKNGISKSEMTVKYGIKPWEVDEMFKHPFLKGRRPSKKKPLSFTFVDDTIAEPDEEITERVNEVGGIEVDPNQITLEDAIDETPKWTAEDSETGKPIELDQDAQDTLNHALDNMVNEDGETLRETFDKEIEEEIEEEDLEIEVENDTFDL